MELISKQYFIFPEIIIDTVIYLLLKLSLDKHLVPTYSYGYDLYNLIYTNNISLKFSKKDILKGESILEKINISKNDKIVTFFIRDNTYNSIIFNENNNYHDYRDCNIEDYQSTANYLASQGYKIIRMGRHTKQKILVDNKIFDYSFSNIKSDFLDLFISSKANFFLTTNTGMETFSTHVCKKTGVFSNFLPYVNLNFYKWAPYSILLPKKIAKNGQLLSLEEIFSSSLCGYINTEDYINEGLEIIDNSPDEILEATKEFIEYQNNKLNFIKGKDLELQNIFWDIYNKSFNTNRNFFKYTNYYKKKFIFENEDITSVISPYFLRKNYGRMV